MSTNQTENTSATEESNKLITEDDLPMLEEKMDECTAKDDLGDKLVDMMQEMADDIAYDIKSEIENENDCEMTAEAYNALTESIYNKLCKMGADILNGNC